MPLARDHLERVRRRDGALLFGGAARLRRVDAGVDLLLDLQALLARRCQAHNRVGAKCQPVFLAAGLGVAQPPELGPNRGHFKVQAATIGSLVSFLTRLGVFDLRFSAAAQVWAFWSHPVTEVEPFRFGVAPKPLDVNGRCQTCGHKKTAVS
jgi:hypothetical protein